jgi:NAD(P)-dependent dehydrogenase (short-subunit alcohol dehydrogenase family)
MAVNLRAPFFLSQLAAKQMIAPFPATRVQATGWELRTRGQLPPVGLVRIPLSRCSHSPAARAGPYRVPAGRAGAPEESAGLLVLLASDAGGSAIPSVHKTRWMIECGQAAKEHQGRDD